MNPLVRGAIAWALSVLLAGCSGGDSGDAGSSKDPDGVVRLDFRNKTPFESLFNYEKEAHELHVKSETGGPRIALAKGTTGAPVGIVLKKPPAGDFDISVTYELLQAEAEGNDWGSGLQVYLKLNRTTQDGIVVARQARGKT